MPHKVFLNLTGYSLDQVLGRNCRFLQGPETDPKAVEKIRRSIEEGSDMSVCLLNYRVDGTTFWNQFFISALRDAAGNITNYVGVQCKVSDQYAANVCKKQEEEFANVDTAVESANVNVNTNMATNYANTTMNVVTDGGNINTNVDANLNADATGGSTTIMDGGAVAPVAPVVTGGTNMTMVAGGTTTMDNGESQTGMEGVTSTTAAATTSTDAPAGNMTVSMNHIKVEPTQPNTGVTGGSGTVEEGTTTSNATNTQTVDGTGDTTMQ